MWLKFQQATSGKFFFFVWKFKLFIIFNDHGVLRKKKKKLCNCLKIIKSLNFQVKFLFLPKLKKKRNSVVNGGFPTP